MRFLSILLAVLVVTVPVIAGSGDGTKIGFDPTRQQVVSSMAQPIEETSPVPNIEIEGKLVPGKALLLSAILPGAGQYYAKSPLMAALFLGLEIGAWAGVAMYHGEGMDKEDEYMAYADAHWLYGGPGEGGEYDNYFQYEFWAASFWGRDKDNTTPDDNFPGLEDEWYTMTWEEKQQFLPADGFTHELDPNDKDQQYYEMIGKYGQFATGWEDYTESGYPLDGWRTSNSITPMRDNYLTIRKESNDALDMSKNFTMAVLTNHLLSALHAGFTVSLHNKKLAREQTIEGAFNVTPKRYNDEFVAMGGLTINF
jgi:hypothetical protein